MKAHLRTIVGIALSLLLLGWVLRDVSAAEVVRELRAADPLLFILAIVLTLAGFAIRAFRWGILLGPVAPGVAFRPRFAAVMIGFAANNLLPARVGEFARALSLARITSVGVAASFATLVVERILDGLALVLLLFIAMSSAGFPLVGSVGGVDPRAAARVVAVLMAGVGVVLLLLVLSPTRSVRAAEAVLRRLLPERLRRPLIAALESFLAGLAVLRSGRLFVASALLAVGQWLFTALSFFAAFRAFGIDDVPFAGAVFLQSFLSIAVAVPSSPGFFGPFEAAARIGLSLWAVEAGKAVSFAVGYHLGGFIPVTVIGLYYMSRLNLSWREVRGSEDVVEDRVEELPGAGAAMHEQG
jgi:glycosyltransferase 2 family protein